METLSIVLKLIKNNYKINFIVEQIEADGNKTLFRLKRRRNFSILMLNTRKYVDDYETNELGYRINFTSLGAIELYLRTQFSEPEGFVTDFFDLK